jgi:hypothetical protein
VDLRVPDEMKKIGQQNLENFNKKEDQTISPNESHSIRDQYIIPKTIIKTDPRSVRGSVEEHKASGQQRKRKQVRQSWEEEKSDGSFDHTRDVEMAIVLVHPISEPSIIHIDGDIGTEVEEHDSI